MENNKLSIDDIFENDEFGLLENDSETSTIKTEEDRLVDSFEEISVFFDKKGREPSSSSMSEYSLLATLKKFRQDEAKKKVVKPFDRHNLLGHVEIEENVEDILDSSSALLDLDDDLSIFTLKHVPNATQRAKTDYLARRKSLSEKEFAPYESMFQQVHIDIKSGKRRILEFKDVDQHLKQGHFYFINGVMIYLESVDLGRKNEELSDSSLSRKDGRTRTVFENGTVSNMYFRSVSKAIYTGGRKMVSPPYQEIEGGVYNESNALTEEDLSTGWVYILKSKSKNLEITRIENLYKIGFSSVPVESRIANARNEATYLFDDVEIVSSYKVHNIQANRLEQLLHRFFAKACLDIEFTHTNGRRVNPREWFVVPIKVIDDTIQLIINGNILSYKYDPEVQDIVLLE